MKQIKETLKLTKKKVMKQKIDKTTEMESRIKIHKQIKEGASIQSLQRNEKRSRATIYRILKNPNIKDRGRKLLIKDEERKPFLITFLEENNGCFPKKKKIFIQFLNRLIEQGRIKKITKKYDERDRFYDLFVTNFQTQYEVQSDQQIENQDEFENSSAYQTYQQSKNEDNFLLSSPNSYENSSDCQSELNPYNYPIYEEVQCQLEDDYLKNEFDYQNDEPISY